MATDLVKVFNGTQVKAREVDRYVNATELCQAAGKMWGHYYENKGTKNFLKALSVNIGIPMLSLVEIKRGKGGSTWIHPQVVIHFAQWVSPEFAVLVTKWAVELLTTGKVELKSAAGESPPIPPGLAELLVRMQDRFEALEARLNTYALAPRETNVGPVWTVQQRLNEMEWFTTSDRQRANIRDRANDMVLDHSGEEVVKRHGVCVYSRSQVVLLDKSIRIERLKAQLAEEERGLGLFRDVKDDGI